METEYVPFHSFMPSKAAIPAATGPSPFDAPVEVGDHYHEIAALKRQLAALLERLDKAENRLDHIEPTVEGLDQTVRDIARQSDVEMWDE